MFGHQDIDIEQILANLPDEIAVLPLRNTVAFPSSMLPIMVGTPRSLQLAQDTVKDSRLVLLVSTHNPDLDNPSPDEVYQVGSIGLIQRAVPGQNGTMQLFVQTLERARINEWTATEPYLKAKIEVEPDTEEEDTDAEALNRSLIAISREIVALMPNVPDEIADALEEISSNQLLVYTIAANTRLDIEKRVSILDTDSVNQKMRMLLEALAHEKELLEIGQQIRARTEEQVSQEQREFFLRRQMESIRRELGETEDEAAAIQSYREKIEAAEMPEEAEKQALNELRRMERLSPQSAEYGVIRTYLEWLVELPWSALTEDNLDIEHARTVLDTDHYDLKDVKDRIIEHLAVRKLASERQTDETPEAEGAHTILLFVGPPGVGKTSLGRSIARALGREFTRMSLGGMRDEAEIRGHRRTYIGAMPGRFIQALKRVGTRNPVMMLDELDKIGADWRGDPASALLEVLDPQQNHQFRDHYLDVDFDLSEIIFIGTANQLDTIPAPLRDRMEVIHLDGYTEYDKIRIAEQHLIARQLKVNSLREGEISLTEEALRRIIREYTRESGVRNLERQIGAVMRKVAIQIAEGSTEAVEVTDETVRDLLGKPRFRFQASERQEVPGVATGLAWTPVGGDVLFVEAARTPGQGRLTITGHLGKVMEESVRIAYSYLYAHADELNINPERFKDHDFHIHVPEGAVPKDGPSAGITMTTALYSLLTDQPSRAEVAMTGEITLRGQVLPVGGIKMKVLAAHRGGIRTVILPERNVDDLDDLPEEVRADMTFIPVSQIDEVIGAAMRFIEVPAPDIDYEEKALNN
ncbi:MAG: endopeptidase La [Chloroflexi bacterium]|nr:endopeptidase La [Chloroflexota bacterium]